MAIKYQRNFNEVDETRLVARKVDELMGIARTFSKQRELSDLDVRYLAMWIGQNPTVMDYPLIRPLTALILSPSLLSPGTRAAVHEELAALVGDVNGDGLSDGPPMKIYDNPSQIVFLRKRFCFTGTFDYGERWKCAKAVEDRGGECGGLVRTTDYLIVGSNITDAWKHSTFGDKISQAKAWQLDGKSIVLIVKESHWVKFLQNNGAPAPLGGGSTEPRPHPAGPGPTGPSYSPSGPKPFGRRTTFAPE